MVAGEFEDTPPHAAKLIASNINAAAVRANRDVRRSEFHSGQRNTRIAPASTSVGATGRRFVQPVAMELVEVDT